MVAATVILTFFIASVFPSLSYAYTWSLIALDTSHVSLYQRTADKRRLIAKNVWQRASAKQQIACLIRGLRTREPRLRNRRQRFVSGDHGEKKNSGHMREVYSIFEKLYCKTSTKQKKLQKSLVHRMFSRNNHDNI